MRNGWRADVTTIEKNHASNDPERVDGDLESMRRKQTIHTGDRSHPQLRALDVLAAGLTYEGWHADVTEAETVHARWPSLFDRELEAVRRRQTMHAGDRSHPQLRALDALLATGQLAYDGWRADVTRVEKNHASNDPRRADGDLESMRRKQTIHT